MKYPPGMLLWCKNWNGEDCIGILLKGDCIWWCGFARLDLGWSFDVLELYINEHKTLKVLWTPK